MNIATEHTETPPPELSAQEIAEASSMGFRVVDARTPPTPAEIDAAIDQYSMAKQMSKESAEDEKGCKAELQLMVRSFGHPVPGSEHSWGLRGALHMAMLTEVTTTSLLEPEIDALHTFLNDNGLHHLFPRLFATRIKHELVNGAQDVLRAADMTKWQREKLQALFGKCLKVTDTAPRIKVELLAKEPKARKARAKKQAVQG